MSTSRFDEETSLVVYSRSTLIGVTYIQCTSLTRSLTESLTHSSTDPSITYLTRQLRGTFLLQKITQ